MRFLFFALLASFVSAEPLFFTLTKADTNYIVLTKTPRYGAVVYRKVNGKFEKITKQPVRALSDPDLVPEVLGDDYEKLLELTSSLDARDMLRKLRHSKFEAGILSMTNIKVAEMLGRIVKDSPVKQGERYTYRVVFLKFNGKESAIQEEKTVEAKEIIPEPPEEISAKVDDKKVVLKWNYREWKGNPEDLVVFFNVYRKSSGEDAFRKINPRPVIRQNEGKMEFVDQWVENGKTYEYRVSAVDLIGREGKLSKGIEVTPLDRTPPMPPSGLIVLDGHGKAILKWNYGLDLDAAGYNVYRSELIGGDYDKVNSRVIPFEKPYFVDTTVKAGRYFFKVTTIDSAGNESKKSNPMMAIIKDSVPPDPPASVMARYKDGKISISWKASNSPDLMGYYVYRGTIRDRLPKIVSHPLSRESRSFVDKGYGKGGFSAGKTYFVGVTAIDSSRNESKLIVMNVVIPDSEPPRPPAFAKAKLTKSGFVKLRIMPSPSLDVGKYRIYRSDEKRPVAELPVGRHFLIDSNVTSGKTYTYSVSAVDTAGNESKRIKTKPVFVKDLAAPAAPQKIKGFYGKEGVRLVWSASSAPDLKGYNVYRSDLPNGRYERLNKKPVKSTEFNDASGRSFHFYKISSVDKSGNETLSSFIRPVKEKE